MSLFLVGADTFLEGCHSDGEVVAIVCGFCSLFKLPVLVLIVPSLCPHLNREKGERGRWTKQRTIEELRDDELSNHGYRDDSIISLSFSPPLSSY